jgi:hypothetical protein
MRANPFAVVLLDLMYDAHTHTHTHGGGGASNDEKHFLLHLLTSQARGGLHFNPFMQLLFAEAPLFVLRNLSRRELSTCAWRRRC